MCVKNSFSRFWSHFKWESPWKCTKQRLFEILQNQIWTLGNFVFLRGGWGNFFKVILMSFIDVQNVFLTIHFDVWDRLGHVWTIFDTVASLGSIFHCHICKDFMSKWADLTVFKAFISKSLIKAFKRSNLLILTQNLYKCSNEKSILATQRCRKWFKHVPIGPKHQN